MIGRPRRPPLVSRCFFGERADRDLRHLFATPQRAKLLIVRHPADHHGVEIPLVENFLDLVFGAFFRHQKHPLLRLGKKNFVGRHALLAQRNRGKI